MSSLLVLLELLFSFQIFCFSALFFPLKLLLNIIPHMYCLLFFQAESHFIVSSSYFLLLCRSLCNISLFSVGFATFACPGSLANGLNKSRKPVPSFLPFPIYTEWSQFQETLATLETHSVLCPVGEHLILVTVFLCSLNGQITPVAGAVRASCASAMGICPSCWTMCHKIPVWASVRLPQVSQHCGVAALRQTLYSASLSAASLEARLAQVMSCLSTLGCASVPISWGRPSPGHSFLTTIPAKPLQPWHRDGFSPPAAEIPLPVPTLTGFVICPQKCCPNCSA